MVNSEWPAEKVGHFYLILIFIIVNSAASGPQWPDSRLFYFPIMDEQKQPITELSDLSIESVGLVNRGAVSLDEDGSGIPTGKNFFLLKSQEAGMDEFTIEEVPATESTPSPTTWQKIQAFVRGEIAKATMTKEQKIAEAAKMLGVSAKDLAAFMGNGDDEDEDVEMGGKGKAQKEDSVSDTLTKSIDDKLAEIQKAHEAALAAQVEAIEKKYESKLSELEKKAQEAEAEVQKATESRERREWIEKADEMSLGLSVNRDELGAFLYEVSKAMPADKVEWLTGVLKAADHGLVEAGLFNEIGTSRTPEQVEPVEKAEKIAKEQNIPLAEALLQLSPEEQKAIAGGILGDGGKR